MNRPKIVLWDLETLPDLNEVMKVYAGLSAYPGLTLKASHTSIICFGYKIFGEKKAKIKSAWNYPKRWKKNKNDDYELCKFAYEVLHDADAVITHNGKRFDWKHLQTRLLIHDLPTLPTSILHIDTAQVSRSNLYTLNNKLDTLGKHLVKDKKLENGGWNLWVRVMNGEKKALKIMDKYCIQDVNLLEKVFVKLRPLIKNLPNHSVSSSQCKSCGSSNLQKRGFRVNKTGRLQAYHCQSCGAWQSKKLTGI